MSPNRWHIESQEEPSRRNCRRLTCRWTARKASFVTLGRSSLSSLPQALSHQRNIGIETFGSELDCSLLLGTHISRHQQLSYFKSIVKTLFRLLAIEKALNKIAIL